jgi:uncharacterized small protein (DUF1192 family)
MDEQTKSRLAEIYVEMENYTNDIVMANSEIAEAEKRISLLIGEINRLMAEKKKLL